MYSDITIQEKINKILSMSNLMRKCEDDNVLFENINHLKNDKKFLQDLRIELLSEYLKGSGSGSAKLIQLIVAAILENEGNITADLIENLKNEYKKNKDFCKNYLTQKEYDKIIKTDKYHEISNDPFKNWSKYINILRRLLYLKNDFDNVNEYLKNIATEIINSFGQFSSSYKFTHQGFLGNQGYGRQDPVIMIYNEKFEKPSIAIQLSLYFDNDVIYTKIQYGDDIKNTREKDIKNVINTDNYEELLVAIKQDLPFYITTSNNELNIGEKPMPNTQPLNQILYGPPGTGKTYNTVVKAIQILDVELYKKYNAYLEELKKNKDFKIIEENSNFADYKMLQKRYNELKEQGRIEFITFHQSYSYEEFVEGIKPYIPDWGEKNVQDVKYVGKDGIFKKMCQDALFIKLKNDTDELPEIYKKINRLKEEYLPGSIIKSQRSEFEIIEYLNASVRVRPVGGANTFSVSYEPLSILFEKHGNKEITISSFKKILQGRWSSLATYYMSVYNTLIKFKTNITDNGSIEYKYSVLKEYYENKIKINNNIKKPYILIIDEINRGNISKIFGELITLIEEDKRAGGDNAITVTLPYSGEPFSVPNNLYIIGTMNTSDRSIASVDIALRRRFKFVEMMPNSDLVADFGLTDEKDKFKDYFEKINKKISILLDRDHQIGHSYFIKTKYNNENRNNNIETLKQIWFDSIIPLLNEYFYGDWDKLQAILGVAKKEDAFIKPIEIDKSFENNKFFKENCENENCFEFANLNDFNDNEKFKKALKNMDAETEQ